MSNMKEVWEKERLDYQKRYANYVKKCMDPECGAETRGHMLECSYVLIRFFGLTPRQVDELEKHDFCGMTQADIDKE